MYAKEVQQATSYTSLVFETSHRGTYCVWELGPIWHERHAWVRYLLSQRNEAAKRA